MSETNVTPDATTVIDADAVIQRLAGKIAALEVQNAMLMQQAETLRQAMRASVTEAPDARA